jgi:phytoene desaturase (3,4-didehydrolycopene-forming)
MKPPSNDPDESNPAQSPSHLGPITNGETPDPPIHKPPNDPIRLQVGERSFTTTRSTLAEESAYFASLLSGRWETARADGSYFVDADPDLFVHIFRNLRRGVLPVFYDVQKGHDEALYDALLKEASFLRIAELESYLENRTYLDRVAVSSWVGLPPEPGWDNVYTVQSDVRMEFHVQWVVQKVYLCPRGISFHKGSPRSCGRKCMEAKGDKPDEYEERHVQKVTAVNTRVSLLD